MTYSPIDKQKLKVILICHDDHRTQNAAGKNIPLAKDVLNELSVIIPSTFDIEESQIIKCINMTKQDTLEAIEKVINPNSQEIVETLAIFYIGHIMELKQHTDNDRYYLFHKDTEENSIEDTGIPIYNLWHKNISKSKYIKNILLYLDVLEIEDPINSTGELDILKLGSLLHLVNIPKKKFSLFLSLENSNEYCFSRDFIDILNNGTENGMKLITLGEIRDSLYMTQQRNRKYKFVYFPHDDKNFDRISFIKNKKQYEYNCDILISYPQSVNFLKNNEEPFGSITKLCQDLKCKFEESGFRNCCIYMSYDLDNDFREFDENIIVPLLNNTNVLFIILTEYYFKSKWCQFLLEKFIKCKSNKGVSLNKEHIYIIDVQDYNESHPLLNMPENTPIVYYRVENKKKSKLLGQLFIEYDKKRRKCLEKRNNYLIDIEKQGTFDHALLKVLKNSPIIYYRTKESNLLDKKFLNQLVSDLKCRLELEDQICLTTNT